MDYLDLDLIVGWLLLFADAQNLILKSKIVNSILGTDVFSSIVYKHLETYWIYAEKHVCLPFCTNSSNKHI